MLHTDEEAYLYLYTDIIPTNTSTEDPKSPQDIFVWLLDDIQILMK